VHPPVGPLEPVRPEWIQDSPIVVLRRIRH
jgi:hypothetical protein